MSPRKYWLRGGVSRSPLLAAACLILALGMAARLGAGQSVDAIIASVDGEPLTMRDLKAFSAAMGVKLPEGDGPEITAIRRGALRGLIQSKLMELELQNFSDQIDDRAIDRYIAKIKEKNHVSDEEFKAEVLRNGATWADYRKHVKVQLEKMELLEHRVRQKISVTPEQIKAYYDAHQQEFTVKDEQFELAQILIAVAPDATAAQRDAARKKAEALRKRALAGEDFGDLARQNSDDDSASKGGELGTFAPDEILDQVRVAVVKLDTGQISELVESSHGFHIIKVEQHQRAGVRPLSEMREEIRAALEDQATEGYLKRWMEEDLIKGHHVETFL
jgi:parvulin-like peptidyl-prolyl isomerase